MITKSLELKNNVDIDFDIGRIIDLSEKNKVIENTDVVTLSDLNKKNILVTYIEKFIKRFVDICAGIIGAVILIPLTLLVYISNKLSKDNGPIFYTQERIGKDGKTFKMLKFRTMVVGADEKLAKYLQENEDAREEYQKYKKLKHDPRITKNGKFLRKTSLDEIPQLLHLITGKMSLVGPRPYLVREKEDMGDYYNIIIQYKPGITGLWQISGRSGTTFNDRLDLDIIYHKHKSLKEDTKILHKTISHVINGKGAM